MILNIIYLSFDSTIEMTQNFGGGTLIFETFFFFFKSK